MRILRRTSAIFFIGVGIIITLAVGTSHDDLITKIFIILILGIVPIKIGFYLLRGKSSDVAKTPTESAGESLLYKANTKLIKAFTPKDDYKHIKKKIKLYRNVSYKGGFPNVGKGFSKSFDIAACKEGVLFMKPFTSKIVVHIPWQHLVGIVSSKEMSQSSQSILTGMAVNSRKISDGIITGVAASFMQRNPLVFQYKQGDRDSFIQEALFDDYRNKKIKAKIMSKRAELYSPEAVLDQPMSAQIAGIDSFDQLKKLAELRDKNIISEEEFSKKKSQILGFV